jgi:tetratricopeptide (TPR) repeat protein
LRATSGIEELISNVARDTRSPLVDFRHHLETVCLEANGHTIVGPESFLDHVHFTIERHADLAMLLSRELAAVGILDSAELSESEERDWRQELDSTISPEDRGIALHTLSMTLGWTGKNHEALRISQQAVKLTPSEGRVHTQLGRLQEKLGDRESALKTYQFAAELDAENPLVLFRLGSLLLDLGRHKEARIVLEHAARNTPANAPETFKTGVLRRLEQCR